MDEQKQVTPTSGNDTLNNIVEQVRSLVQQGNARRLIVRKDTGEKVFEVTLTIAVIAVAVLFFMGPWGFFAAIAAAIAGIAMRLRIDILREIGEGDSVTLHQDAFKNEE